MEILNGMKISINTHLIIGFAVRFLFILYGVHHDASHPLPFTDVDYRVYTDAAREVVHGGSPYDRHTYRYTPFLALMLIPNITLHYLFGKVLFSLFDCLVSKLIYGLAKRDHLGEGSCRTVMFMWFYNPFVMAISARGSSDSIQALLTMFLLLCLKIRLPFFSGAALGMAVHWKLYPVIYAVPIYLSFTNEDCSLLKRIWLNQYRIKFVMGMCFSFGILSCIAYLLYGQEYIEEAFLYHFHRIDTKHNFSVYFYLLYISSQVHIPYLSFILFIPQFILCLSIGFKYSSYKDLNFGLFAQTFLFVAFNKVITSQYFLWFLIFTPLISYRVSLSIKKAVFLCALWAIAQASWLFPAYLLEYQGINVFFSLWLESIAFFCCNVGIFLALVSAYEKKKSEIKRE